jgi:hypothetical protein
MNRRSARRKQLTFACLSRARGDASPVASTRNDRSSPFWTGMLGDYLEPVVASVAGSGKTSASGRCRHLGRLPGQACQALLLQPTLRSE